MSVSACVCVPVHLCVWVSLCMSVSACVCVGVCLCACMFVLDAERSVVVCLLM